MCLQTPTPLDTFEKQLLSVTYICCTLRIVHVLLLNMHISLTLEFHACTSTQQQQTGNSISYTIDVRQRQYAPMFQDKTGRPLGKNLATVSLWKDLATFHHFCLKFSYSLYSAFVAYCTCTLIDVILCSCKLFVLQMDGFASQIRFFSSIDKRVGREQRWQLTAFMLQTFINF